MNVLEIISEINRFSEEYNVSKEDILVTHDAALALLKLTGNIRDIKITVPQSVFDRFIGNGFNVIPTTPCRMMICVNKDMDIHTDIYDTPEEEIQSINGVRFTGMKRTLEDYLRLDREKDQPKIALLKQQMHFTKPVKIPKSNKSLNRLILDQHMKFIDPSYKTTEEVNMEYIRPKSSYVTRIQNSNTEVLDDGIGGNIFAVETGKGTYALMDNAPSLKRPTRNKVKTKAQKQARKHNRK